jgi:hypothetical protein
MFCPLPILKNSITFQDVEDTSFFEQYIDGLSSQACGNAMYKVLGVKHKFLNNYEDI